MTATSIPFRLMLSSPSWLPQLDERLAAAKRHFPLCFLEPPFAPGGYTAWVARGSLKDGRRVVLKIGDVEEIQHEARALRQWDEIGVSVRLIGESPGTLLLEYVEGPSWTPSADNIPSVVEMCQGLWQPCQQPFSLLSARAEAWMAEFPQMGEDERLAPYLGELKQRKPPEGRGLCLLHGDLHREHLFLTERGVVAIDPDPLLGVPAFDVEPLLRAVLDEGDLALAEQMLTAFGEVGIVREEILWWALLRDIRYAWLSGSEEMRREVWLSRLGQLTSL